MQKIMNFEKIEMRVIIKLNEYIEYLGFFWGVWGGGGGAEGGRWSILSTYMGRGVI